METEFTKVVKNSFALSLCEAVSPFEHGDQFNCIGAYTSKSTASYMCGVQNCLVVIGTYQLPTSQNTSEIRNTTCEMVHGALNDTLLLFLKYNI